MPRNYYTEDEVTLCTYIAMYGANEFDAKTIHNKYLRSLSSIKMKIQNIVSMLDEEGIERYSTINGLTGVTTGGGGRRTNWNWVQQSIQLSKNELLVRCKNILKA
jgi:hypothetical protein